MQDLGEFDIARSIRAIEGLKVSLIKQVAQVYAAMQGAEDGAELVADALAGLVLTTCRLSERLGVGMEELSGRMEGQIRTAQAAHPEAAQDALPVQEWLMAHR
jgi:hypothetical protein